MNKLFWFLASGIGLLAILWFLFYVALAVGGIWLIIYLITHFL